MLVTFWEVASGSLDVVCLPFEANGGVCVELEEKELATLRAFINLTIEVSSPKVLPLQVYRLGVSPKCLGLFPREGNILLPEDAELKIFDSGKGHTLFIYRNPFSELVEACRRRTRQGS